MEAKELRIGNLVSCQINDSHQITGEVYNIQRSTIRCYVDNELEQILVENGRFKPIPLTEEWLIKFAFVRQGKRDMWIKDKVCVVLMDYSNLRGESTGNKFYIGFKDMGNVVYHTQFEVPYVHTLQNAYSLTGEELQIIE